MRLYDILLAKKLNGGGGGGSAVLINKNISSNGTYNASTDNADGYKKVVVSVPNSYVAGDEGKVVSNGALVSQSSATYDQNGTYDTTLKNSVTVNVPTEQDLSNLKPVVFVDYDGTVVEQYTVDEFLALNSLPSNPVHSGLTAQGWNWTLANAKAFVQEYGCVCIGQNYITSDGLTKLYLSFDEYTVKYDYYVVLQINSGTVTIDWGDGSETVTTSGTGSKRNGHTYSQAGNYVITIKSNNAEFYLGLNGSGPGLAFNDVYPTSAISADALKKLEIGEGVTCLARQCFSKCNELQTISIPTTVIQFGNGTNGDVFTNTYRLKCVVVPKNTVICGNTSNTTPNFNLNMLFISLPDTSIKSAVIYGATAGENGCRLLLFSAKTDENMGYGVFGASDMRYFAYGGAYTSISTSFCRSNHLVEKIVIPSTVTEIKDYAMTDTYANLYMKPTAPPTLVNSRAINAIQKIYIPYSADHSILSAYQTATNWSTYASKMEEYQ